MIVAAYVIGYLAVAVATTYALGRWWPREPDSDDAVMCILAGFFWPVMLPVLAIMGPMFDLLSKAYARGEKRREARRYKVTNPRPREHGAEYTGFEE